MIQKLSCAIACSVPVSSDYVQNIFAFFDISNDFVHVTFRCDVVFFGFVDSGHI